MNADDELPSCAELINRNKPSWREDVRNEIIEEVISDSDEPSNKEPKVDDEISDQDEEFDCSPSEPVIKSSAQALKMAEQLSEFADFQGFLKVNDILRDLRFIREPRKQTYIDNLFTPS